MGIFFIVVILIIVLYLVTRKKQKPSNVAFTNPSNIPLPDFAKKNDETGEINLELKFEDSSGKIGVFLIVDVETTGLPKNRNAKPEDLDNWPRILQISWILFDLFGKKINSETFYIKQFEPIPVTATEINGIDDSLIAEKGEDPIKVWSRFKEIAKNCEYFVSHNVDFDLPIIEAELIRNGFKKSFSRKKKLCTMKIGKNYCQIYRDYGRGYKYPKLDELFKCLFFPSAPYFSMTGLHDSSIDVFVTAKCFFKLYDDGYINLNRI
jgi:DNA polymerase III subunit alpha